MKILFINSVCGAGSTGRICAELARHMEANGNRCRIAYGRSETIPQSLEPISLRVGSRQDILLHAALSRVTDRQGFYSRRATKAFLEEIRSFDPDLIHLHNLHGYYLHLPELFAFLKEWGKPVVWTLHDCWPFTGHCAYYSFARCSRWKTACHHCSEKKSYPQSVLMDSSARNYQEKRRLFTSLENLTLVTPSQWLAEQTEQSFLGGYPVHVIPNGIDLDQFRPTASNLRQIHHLEGKKVVLGVAAVWDRRKGMDTFLKLADRLGEEYRVVLIGLTQAQAEALPDHVLGIRRTNSVQELAGWYTLADVFVNTSMEETMGMTTVEAAACGAPVVVLDATALPEVARDLQGAIVPPGDLDALCSAVEQGCTREHQVRDSVLRQFHKNQMTASYEKLYGAVLEQYQK